MVWDFWMKEVKGLISISQTVVWDISWRYMTQKHLLTKDRELMTYQSSNYSIVTVRSWKSTEQWRNATSSKMSKVWIVSTSRMCQTWKHIIEHVWPLGWRNSNRLYAVQPIFPPSFPHHLKSFHFQLCYSPSYDFLLCEITLKDINHLK